MTAPVPPPPPTRAGTQQGRPVSFWVAIFLGLLLLVSGALNLLLLLVSAFGSAGGALGGTAVEADDGGRYELVTVDGDRRADDAILRIPIEGAISEGSAPLLGAAGRSVSQVRRALRVAEREDWIKAVLLDINSPGGGVTDSDEIWRLIVEFREARPKVAVLALLGDIAASGGYYIAVACPEILARRTTTTGSIGVVMSGFNYGEALAKIGVKDVTLKSKDTPYKDILSPTRPMLPEEEAKLLAIVQELYERFLDVVAQGRPQLDREQVRAAATGEVFAASKALELGLIDGIGSLDDAVSRLSSKLGLPASKVVELRRVPSVFDGLFGVRQPAPSWESQVAQLLAGPTGPRFMYYWRGAR